MHHSWAFITCRIPSNIFLDILFCSENPRAFSHKSWNCDSKSAIVSVLGAEDIVCEVPLILPLTLIRETWLSDVFAKFADNSTLGRAWRFYFIFPREDLGHV